jgi:hypothetical protein
MESGLATRSLLGLLVSLGVLSSGCGEIESGHVPVHESGLQGTTAHSFEGVRVGGAAGELSHTFTLQHTGRVPLTIDSIKTTCGCVAAAPSSHNISPGDVLSIDASMKLGGIGRKEVVLSVLFTDDSVPPLILSLSGQGVAREVLLVRPQHVRADRSNQANVSVSLVTPHGGPPPTLRIECPEGVQVRTGDWLALPAAPSGPKRYEQQLQLAVEPGFQGGVARFGIEGHPHRLVRIAAAGQ